MRIVVVLLLLLILVNIIGLSVLILTSRPEKLDYKNWYGDENGTWPTWSQSTRKSDKKKTHIDIRFNSIMDIYRIDMSCDFIINDLSGRVSEKYKNTVKKCSLSSLDPSVDQNLQSSLLSHDTTYTPALSIQKSDFDPFVNKTNRLLSERTRLGGAYTPEFIKGSICNEFNLDYIVFIVPYTTNRLDNLRVFLINMHNYIQALPNQFKYKIVVAEQVNSKSFNKGRLFNTAVQYVIDSGEYVDCVVLHDVDMIPSNSGHVLGQRGDYRCRHMPWHLSRKVYLEQKQTDIVYNKFLTGGNHFNLNLKAYIHPFLIARHLVS